MRKQFMVTSDWVTTTAAAADDAALGAWVRLHAYCAPRCNGGRLAGAKTWGESAAMRTCGVSRGALGALVTAGLGTWEANDLVLSGYDSAGEQLWGRKSHGGKDGRRKQLAGSGTKTPDGSPSGTPRGDSPGDSPQGMAAGEPQADPSALPRGDSEGDSEGDGESEGESVTTADASADRSDPRLVAVVSAGGWLTYDGEDLTGQWIVAIDGQTPEQILDVMAWGRRKTGLPVHFPGPSGYEGHRKAMNDAQREASRRERDRALADAHKQAEAERNSQRAKDAGKAHAEARALIGAILSVFAGDPDGWCNRMSGEAAGAIAKLREAYDANRQLSLLWVVTERHLPAELLEQARARVADAAAEAAT